MNLAGEEENPDVWTRKGSVSGGGSSQQCGGVWLEGRVTKPSSCIFIDEKGR